MRFYVVLVCCVRFCVGCLFAVFASVLVACLLCAGVPSCCWFCSSDRCFSASQRSPPQSPISVDDLESESEREEARGSGSDDDSVFVECSDSDEDPEKVALRKALHESMKE